MKIEIKLNSQHQRWWTIIGTAIVGCLLLWWTILNFITGVITDPHIKISQETLAAAALYFPNSGRLQSRLAARLAESNLAENESRSEEEVVTQYEYHMRGAPLCYPLGITTITCCWL